MILFGTLLIIIETIFFCIISEMKSDLGFIISMILVSCLMIVCYFLTRKKLKNRTQKNFYAKNAILWICGFFSLLSLFNGVRIYFNTPKLVSSIILLLAVIAFIIWIFFIYKTQKCEKSSESEDSI